MVQGMTIVVSPLLALMDNQREFATKMGLNCLVLNGKVKDMILIGQTAEKIKETALACGFTALHMCEDLKEAVTLASELAQPGDAVLLSPACASWGQFQNYEQRGDLFKEYANALQE